LFLIFEHRVLVGVDNHRRAKKPSQVVHGVLRKRHTAISQDVAFEVFLCDLSNRSDSLFAAVFDAVEALFQLSATLLLRAFGNRLRGSLGGLLDTPSGKPELVPPDLAPLEERHPAPPVVASQRKSSMMT
jgi:hypothetical protein